MSGDEEVSAPIAVGDATEETTDEEYASRLLIAKDLYASGSRNYLIKNYAEAADELSQVCSLFEELYGELADELGMPYLLYAKSLTALALDENKVIDVPDEEADDDDIDDDLDEEKDEPPGKVSSAANLACWSKAFNDAEESPKSVGKKTPKEADSTAEADTPASSNKTDNAVVKEPAEAGEALPETTKINDQDAASATAEDEQVSSTAADGDGKPTKMQNGTTAEANPLPVVDNEKPSTSNGITRSEMIDEANEIDEETEAASNLQLAWEILELAAKIFGRQGTRGYSHLADVHTELGNIEFENNVLDAAREDYEKALSIYADLAGNHRRAMAEVHYKIGLSYLMDTLNKEGAQSFKQACELLDQEIESIRAKDDLSEKDKLNIQDMEETKVEIWAKINEIEETRAQEAAEVRAALDSYMNPMSGFGGPSTSAAAAATSSSSASSAISSSTKPNDISHLIKRKKPEEPNSEAEAAESPAKRPAV